MLIKFYQSRSSIQSLCFPVYGKEKLGQYKTLFPSQRKKIVRLSYQSNAWTLYYSSAIDVEKINDFILLCHSKYPLDIEWVSYGLVLGDEIRWLSSFKDGKMYPNPMYDIEYNLAIRQLTEGIETQKRGPDNLVFLYDNRFVVYNSYMFVDFFIFSFFGIEGSVPPNLLGRFHSHVSCFRDMVFGKYYKFIERWYEYRSRDEVIQMRNDAVNFMSPMRRNKIEPKDYAKSLKRFVDIVREELFDELMYIYNNREEYKDVKGSATMLNILNFVNLNRATISKNTVIEAVMNTSNFNKYIFIEYLKYRSKIVAPTRININPILCACEILIQ